MQVSVLITTLNACQSLARCLSSLKGFDDIIVIDSLSTDDTRAIAVQYGARVENFTWDGRYPKKRQWVLDHIQTKYDYIFFIDADEIATADFIQELKSLDLEKAGYFVRGRYIWQGRVLNHGLQNNKLVLLDKNKIEFPVVDDLDITGMGEMEGHYQPVLKAAYRHEKLGQIKAPIHHDAYEDADAWQTRHERYAQWEAKMIERAAYPKDPNLMREKLKSVFRRLPCRGVVAFIHSYIFKRGFLDGRAGYEFAKSRRAYYRLVANALAANKQTAR